MGLTLAGTGAWLLQRSAEKDWLSPVWVQLSVPALAISAFAVAQSLHGSGYIAAFTGGMLFGSIAKHHTHKLVMVVCTVGLSLVAHGISANPLANWIAGKESQGR